jgi:hypothetical protein
MRVPRLLILLAAVAGPASDAQAQNFFEQLFGIRRAPPAAPVPPAPVGRAPAAPPPAEYAPATGGGAPPEAPPGVAQPAAPAPPKPVVLKTPTEDAVLGRDLKQNGTAGSLKVERSARGDFTARVTLAGTRISQPTEACTVKLGEGEAVPLASQGRPEGVPRYEAQAPACPIRFDVLEGAVLATAPAQACTFEAADCKVEPRGLWGPEPSALLPRASELEQARGSADRAVRENYKVLTQSKPQDVRAIVAEQAAFSSDREMLCRSYAREAAHGFCNVRFSEARALALAARLGLNASPQAAAPRRRGTTQVIEPER